MKVPKALQPLIDDGVIDEAVRSLKSGKEATVYLPQVVNAARDEAIRRRLGRERQVG